MAFPHRHEPPPPFLVDALVAVGITRDTALAMDRIKAEEVLELLASPTTTEALQTLLGRLRPAW